MKAREVSQETMSNFQIMSNIWKITHHTKHVMLKIASIFYTIVSMWLNMKNVSFYAPESIRPHIRLMASTVYLKFQAETSLEVSQI